MYASGGERCAVKPSVSDSPSRWHALCDTSECRGGMPDVSKIAVDAVSRDKATEAPAVDSTARLFDHLRGRVGHRPERRIRLDDRGQPDIGHTRILSWAAPDHLLHMFEPRQTQPDLFALRGALISVELAPIADVRVNGIEGKARDGSPADERSREKRRRCRGFRGHAGAVKGDRGVRRLRRIVGDAKLTGRDGGPFVQDRDDGGGSGPARHAPKKIVCA